jgi:DNA-binding MltR family transcriptional regulator
VRDNLLFKIYVSKWINFVIQDVLTENEPNHLKLLKELFRDNEFLVKYFVDSTLIGKLTSRMLNQKEQHKFVEIKYLEIFRLFCIVGNNINTGNQIILLEKFIKGLKKTPTTEIYQITVSKQSIENSNKKEIFTEATIDKQEAKKRRFNDYKKICKEEYNTAWAYFV